MKRLSAILVALVILVVVNVPVFASWEFGKTIYIDLGSVRNIQYLYIEGTTDLQCVPRMWQSGDWTTNYTLPTVPFRYGFSGDTSARFFKVYIWTGQLDRFYLTDTLGAVIFDSDVDSWSLTDLNVEPVVVSVIPLDNAVNVPTDSNIVVKFSTDIDDSSLSACEIVGVNTVKTVNGKILTFNPVDSLQDGKQYVLNIAGVKSAAGKSMLLPYTSKFTTYIDLVSPTITDVSPVNNSVDNSINASVNVTFSENIDKNSTSQCLINGVSALTTVNNNIMIIKPTSNLEYLTDYNVVIKGVKDLKGNIMAGEYNLTFKTVQDVRPIEVLNIIPPPDSENIEVDTQVQVQFNKSNLNETTINGVRLMDGETEIDVDKTLVGDTVFLKLKSDLENNKTYSIDIFGVKDVLGNGMASPVNVTFRTLSDTSPFTVQSVKPPMSSVVGLKEAIEIMFNKNVVPNSVVYAFKDKAGNNVDSIKSVVGKRLLITPVLKNNESYTFNLTDASDTYGNHIASPINLKFETMKTTGDTDMDGLLTGMVNLFKNSKYFGLIIIAFAITVGLLFIVARWLWMRLKEWIICREIYRESDDYLEEVETRLGIRK